MSKLLVAVILVFPLMLWGAKKRAPLQKISSRDIESFATMISTFDLSQGSEGLKIDVRNVNGQKKSQVLTAKVEDFEEYSKYSFKNPHQENHNLDLYIFEKVKPITVENKDVAEGADISDLRFDLQVLLDSATKKSIKSKAVIYYKDSVIAEGSLDNNSAIKFRDDLSGKIKNCKLEELKVTKNLLGSDRRSLDVEVTSIQSGRALRQKLSLNLLNMKLTPKKTDEIEEMEEELDLEGEKDETSNTDS